MSSDEHKEEYSIIRVPFELLEYQVKFIKENNLEEEFNRYWKDWQAICEARGVDK
jgi:hypothetical protein